MRKRTKRLAAGLTIAAILGGAAVAGAGDDPDADTPAATAQATRRDLAIRASAGATVSPPGVVNLGFATSGRLAELSVAPGATVSAGQVLARLDPTDATLALQAAQAQAAAADARLAQAQAGRNAAQVALDEATIAQAQTQLDRSAAAAETARRSAAVNEAAAIATVESAEATVVRSAGQDGAAVAEARAGLLAATNALAQARQQAMQTIGEADGSLGDARAGLAVARAQVALNAAPAGQPGVAELVAGRDAALVAVAQAQRELERTELRAPVAAVVTAVNGRSGELVGTAGAALIVLQLSGPTEVRANLVEADAARLAVGQPATVHFDAVVGPEVTAHVATIDPTAVTTSNVVNVGVRFTLDTPPPAGIRPGMSATVEVTVEERRAVLTVAAAAVSQHDGQAIVRRPADEHRPPTKSSKRVEQAVELGARSDGFIEVLSGLDEGATVFVAEEVAP